VWSGRLTLIAVSIAIVDVPVLLPSVSVSAIGYLFVACAVILMTSYITREEETQKNIVILGQP
jgi:hypothetical protein